MQVRLLFGIASQRVSPQIDPLAFIALPKDMMAIFFDFNLLKVFPLLQPTKDTPLGDKRPEVDHAPMSVGEDKLEHTMNRRFGGSNFFIVPFQGRTETVSYSTLQEVHRDEAAPIL